VGSGDERNEDEGGVDLGTTGKGGRIRGLRSKAASSPERGGFSADKIDFASSEPMTVSVGENDGSETGRDIDPA
jgi:hypothetical protein